MFLLGNTAYADNDWTWSCEVKTLACENYCRLMQKNEFSPMDHSNLVTQCALDKMNQSPNKMSLAK